MHDSIVHTIDLNAPIALVWQAISDHQRFGEWFQVDLEGPFRVGDVSRGRVTHPGYERLTWVAVVEAIQPEERRAQAFVENSGEWEAQVQNIKAYVEG